MQCIRSFGEYYQAAMLNFLASSFNCNKNAESNNTFQRQLFNERIKQDFNRYQSIINQMDNRTRYAASKDAMFTAW